MRPIIQISPSRCIIINVKNDRKFVLSGLLSETSPAVPSSYRMWVHPINKELETHGEYHHLMPQLIKDHETINYSNEKCLNI